MSISTTFFPLKLMEILDTNDKSDIVSWLPNGKAFIIHSKARFENEVLPHYFKKAKYPSFTRRLRRWNFSLHSPSAKLIPSMANKSVYRHPLFIQANIEICLQMRPKPQPKFHTQKKEKNASNISGTKDDSHAEENEQNIRECTSSSTLDSSNVDHSSFELVQHDDGQLCSNNSPGYPTKQEESIHFFFMKYNVDMNGSSPLSSLAASYQFEYNKSLMDISAEHHKLLAIQREVSWHIFMNHMALMGSYRHNLDKP